MMLSRYTTLGPTLHKIQYWLLICFACTIAFNLSLPFTRAKINNVFLVLLIINAIPLSIIFKSYRKPSGIFYLFVGIYVADLAGLLQTENLKAAIVDLSETKIALLLLPFVIFFLPSLTAKETKRILLLFAWSTVVAALYCLFVAGSRYFFEGSNDFTYHDFSMIVGMHAIYFAMVICFSIAVFLYFFPHEGHWRDKILLLISIGILVICIFLLSARLHQVLLFLSSVAYVIYQVNKRINLSIAVLSGIGVGVIIAITILAIPDNRERFKQLINYKGQYKLSGTWGEQQMRPLIWSCSFHLIKQKPVTGYGAADVLDELEKCYKENEYISLLYFKEYRFNAHNQYLQVTLSSGIIALIIFVSALLSALGHSIKQRKLLYTIFLLLFSASCMSESYLERHNGVVFFAFFNSLLFFYTPEQRENVIKTVSSIKS